jgi:hypothetical protein
VALLPIVNSGAALIAAIAPLSFIPMEKGNRKAKITAETQQEALRLKQLWDTRSHPSQAEFGETYKIGNQSAVGQFLRGEVPLSLNAARGFALGLGCQIGEFSPRLAALQDSWPFERIPITRFLALSPADRAYCEGKLTSAIEECEAGTKAKQVLHKMGAKGELASNAKVEKHYSLPPNLELKPQAKKPVTRKKSA